MSLESTERHERVRALAFYSRARVLAAIGSVLQLAGKAAGRHVMAADAVCNSLRGLLYPLRRDVGPCYCLVPRQAVCRIPDLLAVGTCGKGVQVRGLIIICARHRMSARSTGLALRTVFCSFPRH